MIQLARAPVVTREGACAPLDPKMRGAVCASEIEHTSLVHTAPRGLGFGLAN